MLPIVRRAKRGLAMGIIMAMIPAAATAHGVAAREPSLLTAFTTWSLAPLPWIAALGAAGGYLFAVRQVNRAHPRATVPRWRVAAWLAGVVVILFALASAIDTYAGELLTAHMVQHLVLTMVAPPLLALGAPVTLLLRVASPGARHRFMLPVLHSWPVKAISWPPVGWTFFAVVMAATHFSPLFNAALENEALHSGEHLLYLLAGVLFWWPVIGADPIRWRLSPIGRMVYLAAQMPFNTAVGLAIYFSPAILYPHYAFLRRTWGPDPLTDQQVAGIVMWGFGDVILLGALVLAVEAWLRADEKRSRRTRERATHDVERASVEGN